MKTPLLMLHGAIGASHQLKAIADKLSATYAIHVFDLPGHGGRELPGEPFSIKLFSDAAAAYIREHALQKVTIFGYSLGGYVAMYLARHQPELVDRVVTLGTKFHWDEAAAAKEIRMLDADTIIAKVPAFAAALAATHAPNDWRDVVRRTAQLLLEMGKDNPLKPEDHREIRTTALIMLGDRDKMVTFEETVGTYQALTNGQMAVLPGTPHAVEKADPSLIAYFMQPIFPPVVPGPGY
jgi:pimeloyl-ACP methyl ester carboxylesterase